jgi:protein tyrosine/serine phosphatase
MVQKAALLVAAVVVAMAGYAAYELWSGNFHTVVAGQLYRSAQLGPGAISDSVRRYGIRTIINLRGENPRQQWYRSEVDAARDLKVTHIDFSMYSRRRLTPEEAATLIDIFRHARKPILVHCNSGADRTGLAAALYVAAIAGQGLEAAGRQISIRFGHLGLPFSRAYAMDESWTELASRIAAPRS